MLIPIDQGFAELCSGVSHGSLETGTCLPYVQLLAKIIHNIPSTLQNTKKKEINIVQRRKKDLFEKRSFAQPYGFRTQSKKLQSNFNQLLKCKILPPPGQRGRRSISQTYNLDVSRERRTDQSLPVIKLYITAWKRLKLCGFLIRYLPERGI